MVLKCNLNPIMRTKTIESIQVLNPSALDVTKLPVSVTHTCNPIFKFSAAMEPTLTQGYVKEQVGTCYNIR